MGNIMGILFYLEINVQLFCTGYKAVAQLVNFYIMLCIAFNK